MVRGRAVRALTACDLLSPPAPRQIRMFKKRTLACIVIQAMADEDPKVMSE